MDDLNDPVQLWFTSHVDTVYRSLDSLHAPMNAAAWGIRETFLGGGKLLVGGSGTGSALSQLFASMLLSRLSMERPPLPVVPIGTDAAVLGAISDNYGFNEVMARQIHALTSPGDALLLVAATSGAGVGQAVRSAQGRDARVILLGGIAAQEPGLRLGDVDVDLRIPSEEPSRIIECQTLVLNCLVELVERGIFGDY